MRRIVVFVGPLLLAACARGTCCPCEGVERPVVGVAPMPAAMTQAAPRIVNPVASTPAVSAAPTTGAMADFRAKVEVAAKGDGRVAAIAALMGAHPTEARALDLEAWAAAAPEGVLVYDLRPFLDGGSDEDVAMAPLGEGVPAPRGAPGRLTRVAMAIFPAAFGGAVTPFVQRDDGLVIAADESHRAAVEAALDRVAVVGGGHVRVRCLAVDDPERVASELGIAPPVPNVDPAAPLTAVGKTISLVEHLTDEQWARAAAHRVDAPVSVDAVAGSMRGSKRSTTTSYVQDFDVKEGKGCIADPVIGNLEAGFALNAYLAPVAAPKEVGLRFEWSRLRTPVETFRTTLACAHVAPGGTAPAVEIDLPELRVVSGDALLPAKVGAGAFVRIGAIVGVLARVEAVTSGPEPKPAWRRVHPAPLAAVLALPATPAQHFLDFQVRSRRPGAAEPTVLSAPKLLVLEGQDATVSMGKGMSYIADVDVEGSQDAVIADPIIASVETGLTIGARVLSRADGTAIIDGTVTLADVSMPLRRKTMSLGLGAPVTIDLPTTRQAVESFRVVAREGEPSTLSLSVPTDAGPTQVDVEIVWRRHVAGTPPATK